MHGQLTACWQPATYGGVIAYLCQWVDSNVSPETGYELSTNTHAVEVHVYVVFFSLQDYNEPESGLSTIMDTNLAKQTTKK